MPKKRRAFSTGSPYGDPGNARKGEDGVLAGASVGLDADEMTWAARCAHRHASSPQDEALLCDALGIPINQNGASTQ